MVRASTHTTFRLSLNKTHRAGASPPFPRPGLDPGPAISLKTPGSMAGAAPCPDRIAGGKGVLASAHATGEFLKIR